MIFRLKLTTPATSLPFCSFNQTKYWVLIAFDYTPLGSSVQKFDYLSALSVLCFIVSHAAMVSLAKAIDRQMYGIVVASMEIKYHTQWQVKLAIEEEQRTRLEKFKDMTLIKRLGGGNCRVALNNN